jgi:hypothetical protein
MTNPEPIQIIHGGRAYNACYRVAGGVLSVESAYGSRSADLKGRSDERDQAQAMLRALVEAWQPGGHAKKKARRPKPAGVTSDRHRV